MPGLLLSAKTSIHNSCLFSFLSELNLIIDEKFAAKYEEKYDSRYYIRKALIQVELGCYLR